MTRWQFIRRKMRRWLAWKVARFCSWLEDRDGADVCPPRIWDGHNIGHNMWIYGKTYGLAWWLYPWPTGQPRHEIGFNALELTLCWRGIEDAERGRQ